LFSVDFAMPQTPFRREQLIAANRAEYGPDLETLRWVTPDAAAAAEHRRRGLLADLAGRVEFVCAGTKLDGRRLSTGCQACTRGSWSCLFISGRCNCRCFYCPTEQDGSLVPTTNTVPFPKSGDYVDYLRRFGFKGASISGGEPLLTLETSLRFVKAVKQAFENSVHVWLYTNGTLATDDTLERLRGAGLDEIRFDIGATGLSLDAVCRAVGKIPAVTVEIPALPEGLDAMKDRVRRMAEAGIDHLNLHQLRLTPYNRPRMADRGYTFLHGEAVTVLESELTAIELIRWSLDQGIDLPINYCSFVYKHRFQRMAARRRSAAMVCKPWEDTTASGYIRTLTLIGPPEALGRLAQTLDAAGKGAWRLATKTGDRLEVAASLWPQIDFAPFEVGLRYTEAVILPTPS
jgi:pyruvate formate-lyase activating enzyme-like uncharacterized protein